MARVEYGALQAPSSGRGLLESLDDQGGRAHVVAQRPGDQAPAVRSR